MLIDIANPEHLLAPGMSARVHLEVSGGESEAVMVPRDAVVTRADGSRLVWRVQGEGDVLQVHPVPVRVGRAQRDQVEVLGDALRAGERVVLLGNERLRPGQRVRVTAVRTAGRGP